MPKRDLIAEIEEIRRRHKGSSSTFQIYNARSAVVCDVINYLRSCRPRKRAVIRELYRYIPIASVACMEYFYRLWIGRLIDHGQPYLDRLRNYKQIRFDHDSVLALHARRITLGEFIAHQISLNGLADINAAVSALTMTSESDRDFLTKVEGQEFSIEAAQPQLTISGHFADTYASVEELFRLRHIYCHEVASKTKSLSYTQAKSLYTSSLILVYVSDLFFESLTKAA